MNLKLSSNKNEKGLDAIGQGGLTFEIKTRRVYDSERRTSETRRINNLIGKNADYLIVVTLNHAFECSGMWIMPMKNIITWINKITLKWKSQILILRETAIKCVLF